MDKETFSRFDQLPRVPLAYLPTPISPLARLSAHLGGPDLFIKRDDQTGLATGGNKTRKLEFLIAQALEEGADCVITAGAIQSNHSRQTAAAARVHGLEPHLVLKTPGGKTPESFDGNLLIDKLVGAVFHWTADQAPYVEAIKQVEQGLIDAGRKPYVVPYGGSNAVGLMGYVEAMRELASQGEQFDRIVFATSSGGTQAGMILGAHLTGLADQNRILGISVDATKDELAPHFATLVNQGAELLESDFRIEAADILSMVNDDYLGGGYAVMGEPEREAIHLIAELEGILVDPVYTGRALAGLIDLIRQGALDAGERILFWHTGGAAALFAYAELLE